MTTNDVLTAREAADLLKVAERSVWRWRDTGRLPSMKLANKFVRFHRSDVEAMLGPAGSRVSRDAAELPVFVQKTVTK